jgi:hypothetical protein
MSQTRRRSALALVCGALIAWSLPADRDVAMAQTRKPITVTHVFTGPDGLSQVETVTMKMTASGDTELSAMAKVSGLQFRRQAPGYFQDFHPASRKQYVITLRGEGEIEMADGRKIVARPGDVLLMEDVTGKGHISRGRGGEDRVTLFIPVAD